MSIQTASTAKPAQLLQMTSAIITQQALYAAAKLGALHPREAVGSGRQARADYIGGDVLVSELHSPDVAGS